MSRFILLLEEAEDLVDFVRNYVPVLILLVSCLVLSLPLGLGIVFLVLLCLLFLALSLFGFNQIFLFLHAVLRVVGKDDRRIDGLFILLV